MAIEGGGGPEQGCWGVLSFFATGDSTKLNRRLLHCEAEPPNGGKTCYKVGPITQRLRHLSVDQGRCGQRKKGHRL